MRKEAGVEGSRKEGGIEEEKEVDVCIRKQLHPPALLDGTAAAEKHQSAGILS